MKFTLLSLIILIGCKFSYAQQVDFEMEKAIIKNTLSQYLNSNPNSIASYLKENKGYELTKFGLAMAVALEDDSLKKAENKEDLAQWSSYSDSIATILQKKKIIVQLSDTVFAYHYSAVNRDLRKEKDWNEHYSYLLDDFKYNDSYRLDTIIGEEYIDLIRKQINYVGEDKKISLTELNNSYYTYQKNKIVKDEFSMLADKVYRVVFNADFTKGCYLFSWICSENKICRSFIFIKKENDQWIYVDDYPSWIIDEV